MALQIIFNLIGFILGFVFKNILGLAFACAVFTLTTRATNLPNFIAGLKAWRQRQRAARARGGEPEPARDGESESEEGDASESETDPESDAASDGESDAESEDASESETEDEATDEAEAEVESDTEGEPTGTDAGEVASEVVGEAESVDARASRVREFAVRKYALPAILALGAFLTRFAPDHPLLSAILLVLTAGMEWAFVKNVRQHAQYFRTEILPALGAATMLWFALASYAESVRYHIVMAIRTTPAVILGRVVSAAPGLLTLFVMATLVISFLLWRRSALEQGQSGGFPRSLAAAEELKKAILKTNVLLVVSAILFGFLIVSSLLSLISTLFGF